MSEKPLISVLMNGYNSEQFLEATLQSLIAQTYDGWQLVFVDNHSTDSTCEIVHKYMELSDLDYRVTPQHMPLGEAREYGLSFCQGDFICFLDTDDLWKPQKLELQLAAFRSNIDALLCYGSFEDIDQNGQLRHTHWRKSREGDLFGENLAQYQVNFQTVMIRRAALDRISRPYFNPVLEYSPDYNLIMRVLGSGDAVCLPDILVSYRKTGTSLTHKLIHRWAQESEFTYNQLKAEGVLDQKSTARQQRLAKAKIAYYQARYFISLGDIKSAQKVIRPFRCLNSRYMLLYGASKSMRLWKWAHRVKG